MRKFITGVFLLVLAGMVQAQTKQLTLQDAMLGARTHLAADNLKYLQFIGGTNQYVYLGKQNGEDYWFRSDFTSAKDQPYFSLRQLNQRLAASHLDTFTSLPPITFNNDNWIVSIKGTKYALQVKDTLFEQLDDPRYHRKTNAEKSEAGFYAYVHNHNLFIAKDNDVKQITTDGSGDIVYASSVHQNEFGISKGTFWSHDGKALAFYRMDQSMIKDYPIIDWTTIPAQNKNIKYPMAGDSSHHVTVGVYHTESQKTIWLNTGLPAEQFLTNIAWSPDDKFIFIAVLNRQQNHMWLNQYDAGTGAFVKTLFEETDEKYTEPLKPVLFLKDNPNQFIWESRRDGWNHLYLYDVTGKLIRQLTKGSWEVTQVLGFQDGSKQLWYMSTEASPLTNQLYLLNLKNLKTTQITKTPGVHSVKISEDGKFVLDSYSNTGQARVIDLIEVKSGKTKSLLNAPDPLAQYAKGEMSIFTLKANTGEDLYCREFKPVGFDSTKKYPVIVYWYGGPHAQMILNSWNGGSGDYWFQYLAERGYVVFTLDTRGSKNRGKAFEQSIHRKTGAPQMEDMLQAITYLRSRSYVDDKNMGLFGWSYGGYMTTNFLLNHPGIFKAGVAGGPVIDWRMYEIMYGERYMDTPQENPEGYKATNLALHAGKLKDKLLLIHGAQDPVVVQQHSMNFLKAAVDAGVQVDYMLYPGHPHNVIGKDRVHLYQKVTDYFELYLK